MKRRGLTLIELLLSLLLLTAVAGASASWMSFAARSAESTKPERWRASAERVLGLIEQDLLTGDFEIIPSRRERDPELAKVRIESEDLIVRTRDRGPAEHRYHLDDDHHRLMLEAADERALLGEVSAFDIVHDAEGARLAVTIESADGSSVAREWVYE